MKYFGLLMMGICMSSMLVAGEKKKQGRPSKVTTPKTSTEEKVTTPKMIEEYDFYYYGCPKRIGETDSGYEKRRKDHSNWGWRNQQGLKPSDNIEHKILAAAQGKLLVSVDQIAFPQAAVNFTPKSLPSFGQFDQSMSMQRTLPSFGEVAAKAASAAELMQNQFSQKKKSAVHWNMDNQRREALLRQPSQVVNGHQKRNIERSTVAQTGMPVLSREGKNFSAKDLHRLQQNSGGSFVMSQFKVGEFAAPVNEATSTMKFTVSVQQITSSYPYNNRSNQ